VIDDKAFGKIREYIAIGRQEGREVLAVDVGPLAQQGSFIGPHIFADVAPNARIAQEEIFGPVLALIRAKDLTEAIAIANGTEYALTGGAYSRSPANLARVRREFLVGNLYLNRPITGALVGRQPFGGFKMSGIGTKAGGPDYLLQFVLPRTITENTMRRGFAPQ
jgi:RHH-type proline utilization regulon transcriptional repressor/proline dehydrogenase/delta 1-pyrroline-5-carboxylate dehydrogenase